MKPSKIKKVGRYLYIYFKIPLFSNYRKVLEKLQKYHDKDSSMGEFMDETGKYVIMGYFLRSTKDIEPYIEQMKEGDKNGVSDI